MGLYILPDIFALIILPLKSGLRHYGRSISRDLRPESFAVLVLMHGLCGKHKACPRRFVSRILVGNSDFHEFPSILGLERFRQALAKLDRYFFLCRELHSLGILFLGFLYEVRHKLIIFSSVVCCTAKRIKARELRSPLYQKQISPLKTTKNAKRKRLLHCNLLAFATAPFDCEAQ